MLNRHRSISTSFAVFLNLFLIMSTVIVFAVLLFLSYENMILTTQNQVYSRTEKTCRDVSVDCMNLYESEEDHDDAEKIIQVYLRSELYADSGQVYIVDKTGDIFYSNYADAEGSYIESSDALDVLTRVTLAGTQQTIVHRTTDYITVISAIPLGDSGYYCLVATTAFLNEVFQSYSSVILLPAAISMIAAIALFVGFAGLMIRPIKEISQTVSKVAEGDYTARIDSKYTEYSELTSMAVSSDLSEMAKTVNSMIETLENQENDRSIFISSIAHDIRTPLTSINGFITAMLDGTIPPEKQEKYLVMIKQEVDRIRKLIVQMTEASSLSHVDPELMEEFNIKDVILDIRDNLEPQLKDKNITLMTDIDESTDNMVYGESQQLCRVIMNIITNAIKFTPVNGKIKVTTEPDNKERKMVIRVEDSGPGVEKDKRNRVFESFYKTDPSRKQEGFGLGLYICKQILIGHGQTIRLDESPELGGANFIFTFPYPPENGK